MKIECKNLISISHPNGFYVEKHSHRQHEMVYCLEGNGYAEIKGKNSEFSTGHYYITRAGTLHTEHDEEITRIIYFHFDAPLELVSEGVFADYHGSVLSCVKQLRREIESEEIYKERMIECLITRILLEALRSSENTKAREGIRTALQYIDDNAEQKIDFKALAKQQHYSFDRFRHIFKEHTGFSPHQYVINARIEKAKFLLKLNPRSSLTEISYNCGFASSSHFTKAFRSKVGMTPSEYAGSTRRQ
ncbi:MAG: AraC family transcriptional regulator [Ruminococcaceae bacterium]|nr:AraC family transcriptional regulator [Oscillospiraceae bacterium]